MPQRPHAAGRVRDSAIKSIRAIREECDRLERSINLEAGNFASAEREIYAPQLRLIGLPFHPRQSSLEIDGKRLGLSDQLFRTMLRLALARKSGRSPLVAWEVLGSKGGPYWVLRNRLREALIKAGGQEIADRVRSSTDGLCLDLPAHRIQVDKESLRSTHWKSILDQYSGNLPSM